MGCRAPPDPSEKLTDASDCDCSVQLKHTRCRFRYRKSLPLRIAIAKSLAIAIGCAQLLPCPQRLFLRHREGDAYVASKLCPRCSAWTTRTWERDPIRIEVAERPFVKYPLKAKRCANSQEKTTQANKTRNMSHQGNKEHQQQQLEQWHENKKNSMNTTWDQETATAQTEQTHRKRLID